MRKAGILTLGFVLVASALALAVGPIPVQECVRVEGVIASIDSDELQIVVADVTVQVTPDTLIRMRGKPFPFENLQVGMTVAACGLMDKDLLVARRVTVKYGGAIDVAEIAAGEADQEIVVAISPHTFLLGTEQSGLVVVHADIPYSQVNTSTLTLNGIAALRAKADLCGNLVAYFDEAAVEATVVPPSATLTLAGNRLDGTTFTGSDTVRVKP